jgi:hypothetical protein
MRLTPKAEHILPVPREARSPLIERSVPRKLPNPTPDGERRAIVGISGFTHDDHSDAAG